MLLWKSLTIHQSTWHNTSEDLNLHHLWEPWILHGLCLNSNYCEHRNIDAVSEVLKGNVPLSKTHRHFSLHIRHWWKLLWHWGCLPIVHTVWEWQPEADTLPNEGDIRVRGLCFCSSFIVKPDVLEYTPVWTNILGFLNLCSLWNLHFLRDL
jgi:hypothetical protein